MTVALCQILGILHLSKQVDIYWHSHLVVASPVCKRNSGWISSGPGALPAFMDLSSSTSSSVVNGVDILTSLLSTFHSSATSFPTCLEKLQSGLVKRPFWSSCDAIALTLTGHLSGLDAILPVRRLIVCQAFRLECVKSMDSTLSIQRSWRFSSKHLIKMLAVSSDPSLDVAAVWCSYSCWHSSSQHGMQFFW